MSKHGGKREGAGVKEGSIRPHITHFWTQKDIENYFKWLKGAYKSKPELAKWVGDQISGKAAQPIIGDPDRPLILQIANEVADKNEIDVSTSGTK